MNRRTFTRQTLSALVGVSIIPPALEKPSPKWVMAVDPSYDAACWAAFMVQSDGKVIRMSIPYPKFPEPTSIAQEHA